MDKKFCGNCGAQLEIDAAFCQYCGTKSNIDTQTTALNNHETNNVDTSSLLNDTLVEADNNPTDVLADPAFQTPQQAVPPVQPQYQQQQPVHPQFVQPQTQAQVQTQPKVKYKKPSYAFEIILFVLSFLCLLASVTVFVVRKVDFDFKDKANSVVADSEAALGEYEDAIEDAVGKYEDVLEDAVGDYEDVINDAVDDAKDYLDSAGIY